MFLSLFKNDYGTCTGDLPREEIVSRIDKHCKRKDINFKYSYTDEGKLVMSFITPFMRRVHNHITQSRHLTFMDSSGGMDRCV